MADYFTCFSVMFDVGAPAHVDRALHLYDELERELEEKEGVGIGFAVGAERGETGASAANTQLWIHDDGRGDPEHVVAFVTQCAKLFTLAGRWGFVFSFSCSKPRLDGFGGGAAVIDLATGESRWTALTAGSTRSWPARTRHRSPRLRRSRATSSPS